jgi:hypothetical protein
VTGLVECVFNFTTKSSQQREGGSSIVCADAFAQGVRSAKLFNTKGTIAPFEGNLKLNLPTAQTSFV